MDLSTQQLFHFVCLVLFLSWVKGSDDDEKCKFGDKPQNYSEGYLRLFPGNPQGRVELRCDETEEWGTIFCSDVNNAEIVAKLICRKLGYGKGSPMQPPNSIRYDGYGPVWNVTCHEQEDIGNCTFTKREEEKDSYSYATTLSFWKHTDDLHVRCGAIAVLDDFELPENIVQFILVDVTTFIVLLGLIILSGFVVYRLLIRKFKSAHSATITKSTYRATTSI